MSIEALRAEVKNKEQAEIHFRELANALEAQNEALRAERDALASQVGEISAMVVSGFYEDEVPQFRQGVPMHELEDHVTAEQMTKLCEDLRTLRADMAEWRSQAHRSQSAAEHAEAERDALAAQVVAMREALQWAEPVMHYSTVAPTRLAMWKHTYEQSTKLAEVILREREAKFVDDICDEADATQTTSICVVRLRLLAAERRKGNDL